MDADPRSQSSRWPAVAVAVLAVGAAVWSLVGAQWQFPYLSNNHDEAVYLLQADALRHGELFPPAPEPGDAFLPWLSVQRGDHYVTKYTPVHASVLAAGKAAFRSERAGMAIEAALLVVVTYLLALAVLRRRTEAVVATAFVALSPIFLIQVTTLLPYVELVLLAELALLFTVRALTEDRRALLVAAGAALGLAFFARPFDAVLVAIPVVVAVGMTSRWKPATVLRGGARLAAGAVPFIFLTLLYNAAATGSALRGPFSLLTSEDTIGFGRRRLLPGDPGVDFTPALGLLGSARHVLVLSFWSFGGLLAVGLAVVALVRRRPLGPLLWVALVAATFPVGYLFFWGAYGTATWGAPWYLGPYYVMPVLVPVAVLGAAGFGRLWRWDRVLGGAALVGMVAVSGFVVSRAVSTNLELSDDDANLYRGLEDAPDGSLVFLPPIYGDRGGLLHPFATARNDTEFDGSVLYAMKGGAVRDLRAVAAHPDRAPYRLAVTGRLRDRPAFDPDLTSALLPLTVNRGPALHWSVCLAPSPDVTSLAVTIIGLGRRATYDVASPSPGDALVVRLDEDGPALLDADGPTATGDADPRAVLRVVAVGRTAGGGSRDVADLRVPVVRDGDELVTLADLNPPIVPPVVVPLPRVAESDVCPGGH